jgi:hypothetical protein
MVRKLAPGNSRAIARTNRINLTLMDYPLLLPRARFYRSLTWFHFRRCERLRLQRSPSNRTKPELLPRGMLPQKSSQLIYGGR